MDHDLMSLGNLAGGRAVARFDDELAHVLENIADPNTEAKTPRAITLRVVFKPDEERRNVDIAISAMSKTAPTKVVKTVARFGIGPQGPVAVEDTGRQMPLFPKEERDPNKVLEHPAAAGEKKEA